MTPETEQRLREMTNKCLWPSFASEKEAVFLALSTLQAEHEKRENQLSESLKLVVADLRSTIECFDEYAADSQLILDSAPQMRKWRDVVIEKALTTLSIIRLTHPTIFNSGENDPKL